MLWWIFGLNGSHAGGWGFWALGQVQGPSFRLQVWADGPRLSTSLPPTHKPSFLSAVGKERKACPIFIFSIKTLPQFEL